MLSMVFRGDKDVIQIDIDMGNVPQQLIHEPLKILRGIFEPKWTSQEFKKAERCDYTSFTNVLFGHGYLMKAF